MDTALSQTPEEAELESKRAELQSLQQKSLADAFNEAKIIFLSSGTPSLERFDLTNRDIEIWSLEVSLDHFLSKVRATLEGTSRERKV